MSNDPRLAALDDQAFATELAIRDIHFDALVRIRARLQPRDGRRLVELWQRAVHPELFEDERMLARMVEDTLAHPSFTADQDAALLDALETSYQRLEPLSRAACEAADLVLPRLAGGGMSAMAAEIDARIAVADQLLGSNVEVLFRAADALPERRRCRLVQNLYPAARAFRNVHAIQTWVVFPAAR